MTTSSPNPARLLLKELNDKYPVFKESKPLAIGINKQLVGLLEGVEPKTLRLALRHHTTSVRYLKAMEKATERYDLENRPAGEVTEEQRKHASDVLRERFKTQAEQRRAAEEAEKAEQRRLEKLTQLTAKFGRKAN